MTLFVVEKPLLESIEVRRSCSWSPEAVTHISEGILFHSSVQILFKSLMFQDCRLATWSFSSLHRFSLGLLISRDWLGYTMTLMCSFVASARRFGSSSCWNTHPPPMFSVLAEGRRCSSCTLSRETIPKRNVSSSALDGWDSVLGVLVSTSVPPNMASRVDAKELNVGLTSNRIMLIINHSGVHLQASDGPVQCGFASCMIRVQWQWHDPLHKSARCQIIIFSTIHQLKYPNPSYDLFWSVLFFSLYM